MKKGDLAAGAVLLCLSFVLIYQSTRMPAISGLSLGPGSLPCGLGICLAVLSVILIFQALRHGADAGGHKWPDRYELKRALLLVLLFGLYTAAATTAGFTLATLAFLIITMRLMKSFSWKFIIVSSVAATAFIYVIFRICLAIPLPGGFLGV